MSTISVQQKLIQNVHDRRVTPTDPPHLIIVASTDFQSNDNPPVYVSAGTAPVNGDVYLDIPCTYSGSTVTVPAFNLIATTDAITPTTFATYNFYLYATSGGVSNWPHHGHCGMQGIKVPPTIVSQFGCSPAGTCADWADLSIYSQGPAPSNPNLLTYSQDQINQKIAQNLQSQVPVTAPFILKSPVVGLTNAQALNALTPGALLKTDIGGTGSLLAAVAGTDYGVPFAASLPLTLSGGLLKLGGLVANGTANQIFGMNAAANGVEYKTISSGSSGSDFAIVNTANSIAFNLPTASAL